MLVSVSPNTVRIDAPAKLNLFLEILGKRADGYHEIETLMVEVNLFDTLFFERSSSHQTELQIQFADDTYQSRERPQLSTGQDNLIMRAARLLAQETGQELPSRIRVVKRIPMAAGLAGGSTDAAAALQGLNCLWNLKLTNAALCSIGAQIGSDIPFFLGGNGAAICRGRGEKMQIVQVPRTLHAVIIKPLAGLSTADVFRRCVPASNPQTAESLVRALQQGHWEGHQKALFNRLGEPARLMCTAVEELQNEFGRLPTLGYLMSGSGSSCFALFSNRHQAVAMGQMLRGRNLGSVFVVQSS